jgi:predicted RNase H-like HicB family nuclease
LAWTLRLSEHLYQSDYDPDTTVNRAKMSESCVMLHVERLPEGGYLATSEAIQGLVAQGRTVSETLEITRDVARRLLESQQLKG